MSEEQPFESLGLPPAAPEPEAPPPAPERYPFWGYPDLALFAGLSDRRAPLAALTLVPRLLSVFHVQVQAKVRRSAGRDSL